MSAAGQPLALPPEDLAEAITDGLYLHMAMGAEGMQIGCGSIERDGQFLPLIWLKLSGDDWNFSGAVARTVGEAIIRDADRFRLLTSDPAGLADQFHAMADQAERMAARRRLDGSPRPH